MSSAEKTGRIAIKLTNGVVNTMVLLAIMVLLAFGGYAIWDSNQLFGAADASNYAIYRPSDEEGQLSFEELQAINPDVFAWLTVFGTGVDYPVVQGEDNMFYIARCAKGNFSIAGSIFLHYRRCSSFTDFQNIFYGHHMANNAMFGDIGEFVDREYFDERQYGMLYFDGREHGLEFFAFLHTYAADNTVFAPIINNQEDEQAYLDMLLQRSMHVREEVPVTTEDRIVLLSTCSFASTNGRDILIGRITDEVFADPFWTESSDRTNPMIDGILGLWDQAPIWVRIIIITLPILLALLLGVLIYKKRAGKKRM